MTNTVPKITVPDTTGPLAVTGIARPRPGQEAALRAEPGCLAYEVGADTDGSVRFMERWASADALRAHLDTEHVRAYASISDELNEPLELHWLTPLV